MKRNRTIGIGMALALGAFGIAGTQAQTAAVKINFWHSMGGVNGEATEKLVKGFNDGQNACQVVSTNVGSYNDGLTKLQAALRGNNAPHVQQIFDLGLQALAESGQVVPISDLARADNYNLNQLLFPLANYYRLGDKYYGMPFNASTAELYYNKNAFKAAGLDPNRPPRTFEEYQQFAQKLTKKGTGNNVEQYGGTIRVYGWFIEQLLYNQGSYVVNNQNGRSGRATAVAYNSPAGVRTVKWIVDMTRAGLMPNVGRDGAAQRLAFTSGKAAMYMESTAALGDVRRDVGNRFEFGTAAIPRPAGTGGGTAIGGGALFVFKGKPANEQECAWEFIKYAVSPEPQLEWHKTTGYYPVTKAALDLPAAAAFWRQDPNARTPIDIILKSPPTKSSQGAVAGVMPEIRTHIEEAMELAIAGRMTVEEALNAAAVKSNTAIARYNASVPAVK